MGLEKNLEKTFIQHGERRGFVVLKIILLGRAGFPDRTILGRGRLIGFAELKKRGKKPMPLQDWWLNLLNEFGFVAEKVDRVDQVEHFYDRLEAQRG